MDERTALLYAQLKPFKALVNKTSGFIRWALERVENPYVACSFGKDSSVMLHLIRQHRPDIPVIFVRRIETDLIDNFHEVIQSWNLPNLITLSYKGFLEGGKTGGLVSTTKDLDFDSFFVGLRMEESAGRRISMKTHGVFFKNSHNKIRICPMSDWKTNDIAAYCLSNNLPTLTKYLKEGFESRTTANISSSFPHETIGWVKRNNPEAYNRLIELLPDAKFYV